MISQKTQLNKLLQRGTDKDNPIENLILFSSEKNIYPEEKME